MAIGWVCMIIDMFFCLCMAEEIVPSQARLFVCGLDWWRTGKPGMIQSMGFQRVGHKLVTEQQPMPEGPCHWLCCEVYLLKCCLATWIFRYCGQVFRLRRTQSYTQLWVGLGISSLVLMEQWNPLHFQWLFEVLTQADHLPRSMAKQCNLLYSVVDQFYKFHSARAFLGYARAASRCCYLPFCSDKTRSYTELCARLWSALLLRWGQTRVQGWQGILFKTNLNPAEFPG